MYIKIIKGKDEGWVGNVKFKPNGDITRMDGKLFPNGEKYYSKGYYEKI